MEIAVWGHPYSEYPEGKDTQADFVARFERMKEAGVGIYLPFVITHGKHFFQSAVLGSPAKDLLGPLVEAGEEVGVEVHPIVGLGSVAAAAEDRRGLYDPGPTDEELPSWALNWPCAAWDEVRQVTIETAADMLDSYSPDGLHMDYVRYPNTVVLDTHPCHCERCQEAREQWLGKPLPEAEDLARPGVVYREVQMRNRFVKSLVRGLREVADEAGLPLSMAARARYLKDAVAEGQDWVEWCEDSLLDFVCPMSYNPCMERFQRFVTEHLNLLAATGTPLYCGIGRSSSLGKINAQEMARQIRYAAERGADGVCVFHIGAFEDEDYKALRQVSQDLG